MTYEALQQMKDKVAKAQELIQRKSKLEDLVEASAETNINGAEYFQIIALDEEGGKLWSSVVSKELMNDFLKKYADKERKRLEQELKAL